MKPQLIFLLLIFFGLSSIDLKSKNFNSEVTPDIIGVVVKGAVASITPLLFVPPVDPISANHTAGAIFIGIALVIAITLLILIATWKNKPNHNHDFAMLLFFLMLISIIISIVFILFTEPGLKPHPLADPVEAAPVQIFNTRSTESFFLLVAIALGSGAMLWLYSSGKKNGHNHAGVIVLTIFSAMFMILGGKFLLF